VTDARSAISWDPARYLEFAAPRARPFVDLIARIPTTDPATVVDLGCGPGTMTALLARRWPGAAVIGIDSSREMVEQAEREPAAAGIAFEVGDVRDWQPSAPVDVVVSNAVLQWVPDHLPLLSRLVASLAPGGVLAFQVPGNHASPSTTVLSEVAGREPFAEHTAGAARPASATPEQYLATLADAGCEVDAWETTYLHVLTGHDPVFTWVSGTALRPFVQALPPELRPEFEDRVRVGLADAYPTRSFGTVLPFRRIFVVAHRPG
jgi:trans-aconitate 2-methyltransferase